MSEDLTAHALPPLSQPTPRKSTETPDLKPIEAQPAGIHAQDPTLTIHGRGIQHAHHDK